MVAVGAGSQPAPVLFIDLIFCLMFSHSKTMKSLTQILAELVSIPSVNPMGQQVEGDIYHEKRMVEYLENFFIERSIKYQIYESSPGRPNILAFLPGNLEGTILLEAHMDTVGVENMQIEPYNPVIRDGKLYGRGSCDTKASLAAMLYAAQKILIENRQFSSTFVIAAVADEEYSFAGARTLLDQDLSIQAAIVGEPTDLSIVNAHKGIVRWKIATQGRAAHGAYPDQGVNAIYTMLPVLQSLQKYAKILSSQKKHAQLGSATLNVGTIRGGTAVNIVPDYCEIEVDRRLLPDENIEQALHDLQNYLPSDISYEISEPLVAAGGLDSSKNHEVVNILKEAGRLAGESLPVRCESYATDAGIYAQAGIPSVVFGPGNIKQAHTENEYVEIIQVEKAAKIFEKLMTLQYET